MNTSVMKLGFNDMMNEMYGTESQLFRVTASRRSTEVRGFPFRTSRLSCLDTYVLLEILLWFMFTSILYHFFPSFI